MKLWCASVNCTQFVEALQECLYFDVLASFFDPKALLASMIDPSRFSFFVDSGAYSAWSRKTEIDLDEYCAFIKANADHIEVYASLDVIPGEPGRPATTAEREAAAEASWQNYLYMRNEGLDPLPVYHYGEDMRFLERMLGHGCSYIGIGGLVGVPGPKRQLWLDDVFTRLTDDSGSPIVKTHGFGMTAIPLIFRYPWFSVDSTTWIKVTANGAVYLPAMRDNTFVFDEVPQVVPVSTSNPKQASQGKHSNSMSPAMRNILDRWLTECGKTYEQVSSHYYHRAVCNVLYFKRVSVEKQNRPFDHRAARRQALW